MKRYLFSFLATLLCSVTAWAFDADNGEGVTLSYNIVTVDGYDYACEVTYGNYSSYEEINIPETAYNASDGNTYTVIGIGESAFYGCEALTSVTFPSTLIYIDEYAFGEAGLTSLTLPGYIVYFGEGAFCGCQGLSTLTIEEGITYLSDSMFEGCESLEEISFPSTLTSIGAYTFVRCIALSEIELPNSITSIGDYAFEYCTSLVSINIPKSVTDLGKYIFSNCSSLSNVTLEEGLTYISDYMFYSCEALTSIDFPSTITTIGEYAFYAGNLTSINLPKNCKTIGDYAFYNNLYVSELTLPEGLEYIGDYAFYQIFYYITDDEVVLTIPESVTYLGSYAFYHCTNMKKLNILANIDEIQKYTFYQNTYLTEVSIPKTVANIGNSAFYSCTALTSITCLNREAPICGTNVFRSVSTSTCIIYVPEGSEDAYANAPIWGTFTHIVGIEVDDDTDEEKKFEEGGIYYQYVDKEAKTVEVTYESTTFYYYIGSITIPTTVVHEGEEYSVIGIGENAFRLSPELTDITINEGITYIGAYAFYQCDALKDVSLPSGLMEIGSSAFYGCTTLPEITIPATVTSILEEAFSDCTALTEMTIPASVTYLGTSIVSGCTNLTTMKLEDGEDPLEVSISSSSLTTTFSNCYISSLYIGRTLSWEHNRYIESPFYNFYTLKYVTFGTQEITLEEYLFRYTSIEDIYIPENVTISDYSFYSCESLKTVTVGASTVGKYAFQHCDGLKEVTLLETVTNLGYYAFESCTSLEEVTLSSNRSGSMDCFMACSAIKKVTLTENVNRVDEWTFYGYNMEEIYSFNPTPPSLGKYSFAYPNKETCVVYVPVGAYDDYKAADIWEDFFNIVEMTEFAIETHEATDITDSSATLNGSITAAYDDPITEKGFEYWTGNEGVLKAVVEGDEMTATVSDLAYDTKYTYRAYATMESGTTEYGEEQTFTTAIPEGISNVYVNDENVEGIYSTSGQKLNTTVKGVNIIRYNDGTTKKVLIK